MPEPTNHNPEYLQTRCDEFIVQVNAQIKVIDRQKVEIAELKESVEAYRLAHEGEFEEIRSLRAQLEQAKKHTPWSEIKQRHLEKAEAQLAELSKPVTDEEWEAWVSQSAFVHNRRKATDALIQSRLPKERQ